MKPFKVICLGVLLWMIMFVVISVFIAFGVEGNSIIKTAGAMIAGFVALALIVYVRPSNFVASLGYGISWVIVGLILDLVITWRFNDKIFYDWSLWLGYGFILIASLLGFYSIENGNSEIVKKDKEIKPPTDIKF